MMRVLAAGIIGVLAVGGVFAGPPDESVSVIPRLPGGPNRLYAANRAPLRPSPLVKLPVGAVSPAGWLRRQLELMTEGFTGRLTEISPWCRFEGSAWVSRDGKGERGWEELPYWLKGFASLGYGLKDSRVVEETQRWVNGILGSQRPDGYFGPESNRRKPDLWPDMIALHALRTYSEATGDARVIPFMLRYFRWQAKLPLERFLPDDWQKWRGGDNLDSIYWLYNRTGEKWLLDLARVNHERTADWVGGIPTWHGVNICQGFREPAQYFQQTADPRYLAAAVRNYREVMDKYGQVPGGMFGADENARVGYTGPRQGAETCSMAEMMFSHELLLGITGDPVWADRCEEVAFNSLPASMTPDLKGLHYLTAPNMVQLDRQSKAPMLQNGGDMLSYNPQDYRCCQHNASFAWPYFAEHLWMASAGNGLAAALYAPSNVSAEVGDGVTATITESTDYPFDDHITFRLKLSHPAAFPLILRIPAWCDRPAVSLNGKARRLPAPARGWIRLRREWRTGDTVQLTLPMRVELKSWPRNRNTASVQRGPLTYSLLIQEKWRRYGGSDRFPACEVLPLTPWNLGLPNGIQAGDFQCVRRPGPLPDQPFTVDAAPILLKTRGRRIPEWTLEPNGLVGEVQPGPIATESPDEQITLIPMGCARLRISAFPQIGGPGARDWTDSGPAISASWTHDTPMALVDEAVPRSSSDQNIPRFTWWDHLGTTEWVEYAFAKPRELASSEVYWFDDERIGGQCRVPLEWKLLWWTGGEWKSVEPLGAFGIRKDTPNTVKFAPVRTSRIRLEARLRTGFSAGILEWKVGK